LLDHLHGGIDTSYVPGRHPRQQFDRHAGAEPDLKYPVAPLNLEQADHPFGAGAIAPRHDHTAEPTAGETHGLRVPKMRAISAPGSLLRNRPHMSGNLGGLNRTVKPARTDRARVYRPAVACYFLIHRAWKLTAGGFHWATMLATA
jgi:hypothetical protein